MNDRLRTAADDASELVAVVDPSGVVVELSPSFIDVLGSAAVGTPLWELVHPADVDPVRTALSDAERTGGPAALAFRVFDESGAWRSLQAVVRADPANDGARLIVGARESAAYPRHDLPALHVEAVRSAWSEVSTLPGGGVDDVGDLLVAISDASRRLLDHLPADSPHRDDAVTIHRSARRAASIVGQILSFSRVQAASPALLDVGQLIARIGPQLRRLVGERIALEVVRAERLWPVQADPDAMEQMFLTLAANARAAMPGGGRLTFEVENRSKEQMVVVSVKDTGAGMDPAAAARAFNPFFTTDGPDQGAGLGLSVVRAIVEDLGGFVQLTSESGRGTTVLVGLPRASSPLGAIAEVPAAEGPCVLLAEDEEGVRELVRDMLEAAGYKVLEAATPSEAMRLCRDYAGPIQLLLTDIVMPEMTGHELVSRVRKARPGLRVMYMSGFPSPELGDGPRDAAGASFLSKPFTRHALLSAVEQAIASPSAV